MGGVFFKLLNMSIAAGWLVLAVSVLRLAFKRAPRWVFCVLWAMVALRLALPFSVQSPFSVVPSVNTVSLVTEPVPAPDEYPAPEVSAPEETVLYPVYTEPGAADPAQTAETLPQRQHIVINTGIAAIDNTIAASGSGREYSGEEKAADIGIVLFAVWASGAALAVSYAAFSYLRLRSKLRCSIKDADGAYICDAIDTPFILGVFRPRIYIPSGMNERERSNVLAHEKAHLKRLDHLWKPLGYLMLAAYWFNPLMWLAYILFCRDIEIACDEKVIKTLDTGSKADYSQTLVELNRPRRIISACPLAFGEVGVKERVKKVLNYKKPALWMIVTALILCAALCACMMTDPVDGSNGSAQSGTASDETSAPAEESSAPGETSVPEPEDDWVSEAYKDYHVTFFTDPDYPDQVLCRSVGATSKYPLYIVEREVMTVSWGGGTGLVFQGKWVGKETGKGSDTYALAFNGSVRMLDTRTDPTMLGDYLMLGTNSRDQSLFLYTKDGVSLAYYDELYTREGSDYIIILVQDGVETLEKLPRYMVLDHSGGRYTLPVPDLCRWDVLSLAFDDTGDDSDAVTVEYLLDGETKREKANLKNVTLLNNSEKYYIRRPKTEILLGMDDITRVEGSKILFKSELYPEKTLVYCGGDLDTAADPYPFCVLADSLAPVSWNGNIARMYLVSASMTLEDGKPAFTELGPVIICCDTLFVINYYSQNIRQSYGKYFITWGGDDHQVVYYGFKDGEFKYFNGELLQGSSARFGVVSRSDEEWDKGGGYVIIDSNGDLRSYPGIADENRRNVLRIEFDPESDDPGAVIIQYYTYDGEKVSDVREKANLADTRVVTYEEYYAPPME